MSRLAPLYVEAKLSHLLVALRVPLLSHRSQALRERLMMVAVFASTKDDFCLAGKWG